MCTRMYGEVSQPWGRMERRETRARPSDGAREHKQYVHQPAKRKGGFHAAPSRT